MKLQSSAYEKNRDPITEVLKHALPSEGSVLEIGSGCGQHVIWFAEQFPNLHWQPSDLQENFASINAWVDHSGLSNLNKASEIDLLESAGSCVFDEKSFDAILCINTIHIVAERGVRNLFKLAAQLLKPNGTMFVYGPYRYANRPLEPSNESFDRWLKARDPNSGVRDFEVVNGWASQAGLVLQDDVAMPSNNRGIWWRQT